MPINHQHVERRYGIITARAITGSSEVIEEGALVIRSTEAVDDAAIQEVCWVYLNADIASGPSVLPVTA